MSAAPAVGGILAHGRRAPLAFVIKTFRDSLGLLGTRRFGTFWFASLLSSMGTWAQQVAEPWLLLTLGASPLLIGLDSFVTDAPAWLLTLVGGALADHADRRRVIARFQSIQMLCPTAIVVLLVTGRIRPWMIVVCSAVVGVTDALSMPSFQSIVPSIVERDQIGRGIALNALQFNLSRVLGPSLAGVLMATVGAVACFVVSAVSYVPFIGVALSILPRWTPPAPSPERHGHLVSLAGIGDTLRPREIRGALLTVLVTSVFCSPLVTFTPILVRQVFQGDAARFSVAVASFGVGGLIGAAGLLGAAADIDRRWLASGAALVYAGVVAATALTSRFWILPPLLVLAGASMTISNSSANALVQSTAPARHLGQTVSVYMLAVRGGFSIGALVTGAAVGVLGVQHTLLANGVAALTAQAAIAGLWLRQRPGGNAPI